MLSECKAFFEFLKLLFLRRWTKSEDLFGKQMVFFPICENSHWYCIVAVRPGDIMESIFILALKLSGLISDYYFALD